MKKILIFFVPMLAALLVLGGCADTAALSSSDGRVQIVSTIFPSYDFARSIAGESADVTLLIPPGMESHSYEPTPQDMIQIQNCDLFLYTGGESDAWVEELLASFANPPQTVKMMDCVETYEEETVDGMQAESKPADAHETEYDEHVWTSPRNAVLIAQAIEQALCETDPAHEADYQRNAGDYISQLEQLDQDFRDFFAGLQNKTLIFGDRFPFRYFAEEYGLAYFAAFPGCSSETEPSAATIAFLIDKVKEENLHTVFYIEFSNHQVADSIAEAAGAKTALFHSCHNLTAQEQKDGATYLSLMAQNLDTLKEDLH
ncbi:MAG: zinc ABC transporter substrate-binding protein [Oscillospiraceae bacterium]|nr:zinc ABC transporter substrate-binding protein [Oscillospiraceae bacterium]